MSWIIEYAQDIESDLSVFHRVEDVDHLTIGRYLMLAPRLSAYAGALRARLDNQPTTAHGASPDAAGDTPPEVVAQLKRAALASRYGVDPATIELVPTDVLVKELSA